MTDQELKDRWKEIWKWSQYDQLKPIRCYDRLIAPDDNFDRN